MLQNEEEYNAIGNGYPRNPDATTMGQAFKQAGYKTAYFGKEHAGDYGWDNIDEFGSMKYSAGGMLAEGSAFDQIFTRDAIKYLKQDHKDPFYMVLSLINPHDICKVLGGKVKGATFADTIFFCRDETEPYLRDQPRPPLPRNHKTQTIPGMLRHKDYMYEELNEFDEDTWRRYIATYCLLVEKTDWYIELVLDQIKASGLEDDTIVVFTTDHGDMMGAHGLIGKSTFYDESIKTMMLVKHPEQIKAGQVDSDTFVGTIDLMPTLIDLAGVDVPADLDGRSFAPACRGESNRGYDRLFSMNHDGRMVCFDTYKYVRSVVYGEEFEILFDLEADPDESTNVVDKIGYEQASEQARTYLNQWLTAQSLPLHF